MFLFGGVVFCDCLDMYVGGGILAQLLDVYKRQHVVDLDGARSGNPSNLPLIEDILAKTMLKVEMGGGIRTMDTLQRIWDAGVNRVVLGTSLISNLDFTRERCV